MSWPETSLDLILVTDRQGVFTRVSPSSLATIGYRPNEMLGRGGADFIVPADLEPTRREMKLALTGRHTRNFDALRPQGRPCRPARVVGRLVGA